MCKGPEEKAYLICSHTSKKAVRAAASLKSTSVGMCKAASSSGQTSILTGLSLSSSHTRMQ